VKVSIARQESQTCHVVLSTAVILCCLSNCVFAVPSRAQISPFFNRFSGTLNEDDVKDLMAAGQRLYGQDVVSDGATDAWSNPKTGNSGTITVLQSFTRDGMQCRKVRYNNRIRNQPDTRIYTLDWCKTPQGVWKIA
jgi:surface antigen